MPGRAAPHDDEATLSIGALSRATQVPVATLRTWEARYGFPLPLRRPSGHRLYPVSTIPRLRRMAGALARGLRAGDVIGASDADLDALLDETTTTTAPPPPPADPVDLLALVERLDGERVSAALLADAARLAPLDFVEARVAPLTRAVGDGWAAGRLEIRHEHLLAERIGDVLRSLRLAHAGRAAGPLVVLATLPGERHVLGLQMAALVVAAAGCRTLYLGAETPVADLVSAARDAGATACAVSVSRATRGAATTRALARLRRALPGAIQLIIGGDGAARQPDVATVASLRDLDRWARALRPRRPAMR